MNAPLLQILKNRIYPHTIPMETIPLEFHKVKLVVYRIENTLLLIFSFWN